MKHLPIEKIWFGDIPPLVKDATTAWQNQKKKD
jgi:hypothetical protein